LTLRRPKAAGKKAVQASRGGRDRGKADEEELLRNLAALETKGSISAAEEIKLDTSSQDLEPEPTRKDVPVRFEMPHPRFNAQLTVQDDTLYIFGGTLEKKDVEITFSDLYSVDLGKLDGVRELYYTEPLNWNMTMEESDEEMDDDDNDDDDDEEMESEEEKEDNDVDVMSVGASSIAHTDTTAATSISSLEAETETETSAQQDSRPFPRPFESLRDFYARTTEEWQRLVLDYSRSAASQFIKELRKAAFEQAEERWWDCREEIRDLEDEQEAAGIGEVVSMADRGAETGVGRRR
jgi:hypothetical protein